MEDKNLLESLDKTVSEYEETLTWKQGGNLFDRTAHVLRQYRQIADNAIYNAKTFLEDCKTQYKAIEIIAEGLTDRGLNHTEKRVIANHIISTLRRMVDRLNNYHYEYSTTNFERYDFFRSHTPESRLYEQHQEYKRKAEAQEKTINNLKEKHPEIFENGIEEIPF